MYVYICYHIFFLPSPVSLSRALSPLALWRLDDLIFGISNIKLNDQAPSATITIFFAPLPAS